MKGTLLRLKSLSLITDPVAAPELNSIISALD